MSGRERSSIKRTVACATGKLCSSHLSGYRSGGFCRFRMHSFNKRTHFGYAYFIFVTSSAALTRFFFEKLATPSRCSSTEVSVDDGCTVLKNVPDKVRFFVFITSSAALRHFKSTQGYGLFMFFKQKKQYCISFCYMLKLSNSTIFLWRKI